MIYAASLATAKYAQYARELEQLMVGETEIVRCRTDSNGVCIDSDCAWQAAERRKDELMQLLPDIWELLEEDERAWLKNHPTFDSDPHSWMEP